MAEESNRPSMFADSGERDDFGADRIRWLINLRWVAMGGVLVATGLVLAGYFPGVAWPVLAGRRRSRQRLQRSSSQTNLRSWDWQASRRLASARRSRPPHRRAVGRWRHLFAVHWLLRIPPRIDRNPRRSRRHPRGDRSSFGRSRIPCPHRLGASVADRHLGPRPTVGHDRQRGRLRDDGRGPQRMSSCTRSASCGTERARSAGPETRQSSSTRSSPTRSTSSKPVSRWSPRTAASSGEIALRRSLHRIPPWTRCGTCPVATRGCEIQPAGLCPVWRAREEGAEGRCRFTVADRWYEMLSFPLTDRGGEPLRVMNLYVRPH